MAAALEDYLNSRIEVQADGCWFWLGYRSPKDGYGRLSWRRARAAGVSSLTHRAMYQIHVGQVPDDLQLDHLCRVPRCCNPDHLEPVTNRENQMRSPVAFPALNFDKTHCPAGHPYNEANTYIYDGPGNRRRCCRACNVVAVKRYKTRKATA